MKLITILTSLQKQSRRLTPEENRYLDRLGEELRRAPNDAARWRLLEREGLPQTADLRLDGEVMARLGELRRAALN